MSLCWRRDDSPSPLPRARDARIDRLRHTPGAVSFPGERDGALGLRDEAVENELAGLWANGVRAPGPAEPRRDGDLREAGREERDAGDEAGETLGGADLQVESQRDEEQEPDRDADVGQDIAEVGESAP